MTSSACDNDIYEDIIEDFNTAKNVCYGGLKNTQETNKTETTKQKEFFDIDCHYNNSLAGELVAQLEVQVSIIICLVKHLNTYKAYKHVLSNQSNLNTNNKGAIRCFAFR